ncbi:MAG: tetratricopeptide repeat protein [Phenylobacterium sp.]|uniref:tetratricopeptide repeat protein n=1 Tax=Phenylobacterium sp. TaxID=1871053 RepID=UPI001A48C82E|nr:tetratricopeptide repeat protein [Phenylobacterium sp.]MBL8554898.1 tetratricopeptide repeat protein [Phenylobacterium sp.]
MRRIGFAVLAAALLGAAPAFAQNSETEMYEAGANAMAGAQREVTQRNIDMATRALREKDYAKARKYAQPVTRADPRRVESWLLLGTAQQGLKDWSGARRTYTTAVRLARDNAEAQAGLGVAYARTGDPKAATQLAWIAAKVRECGGCWRAGQLARFKTDIETALADQAQPAAAH